jgi:hypothetical protein
VTEVQAEAVKRMREILRNWRYHGPLPDLPPGIFGYGPIPIPVDDLTDEQVVEVARQIGGDK